MEKATPKLDWNQLLEEAITLPGSVGNVYNRFYEYSFMNQMLLRLQGITEPVATYKRWQSVGRQVLKGSKAKVIVRPVTVMKEDEATGEKKPKMVGFKEVPCIFALSETEGDELPPFEAPGWDLDQALDHLDITQVPYTSISGNAQGYSYERNFAINPVAVYPVKTTFHELSHIVSGHTTPDQHAEYVTHRGIKEFEAEGAAHLIMNELGEVDEEQAAVSRGYLQGWLREERPPETSIKTVFKTTDTILKAGRVAVEGAS